MAIQVLSLEHNNSKENMKIAEFSEFDEFPDEIDKFWGFAFEISVDEQYLIGFGVALHITRIISK